MIVQIQTKELARQIRINSLKMCHKAKASHIGGCLSCADILAVLYNDILRENDKLIVSKGHCASAVYSALAFINKIPMEYLDRYCQDGAELGGHVTFGINGVEVSTGSLGHGLSIGCGLAIVNPKSKIFVLMSDGELDEGSTWEAASFASEHYLRNLMAIVDCNELKSFSQSQGIRQILDKFIAFGWHVERCNGHNVHVLNEHITRLQHLGGVPKCIVAHTVKGKGVAFIENKLEWHYKYPNKEELKLALEGLV